MHQIFKRICDSIRENGLAVDSFGGVLRIECEERPFGVNDVIADFYFLIFVDECFSDIGVVSVANGGAAHER